MKLGSGGSGQPQRRPYPLSSTSPTNPADQAVSYPTRNKSKERPVTPVVLTRRFSVGPLDEEQRTSRFRASQHDSYDYRPLENMQEQDGLGASVIGSMDVWNTFPSFVAGTSFNVH